MEQADYVALFARVQRATTIAELHGIATEARAAHPDDVDAERIADLCQAHAFEMMARLRHGRSRSRARPGDGNPPDYTERAYR